MSEPSRPLLRNPYAWVVFMAFASRLSTLGLYPLADTTEARYSEIARKVVETGNWLMPQFDYGVPFWGKPPLATWMWAASFELFGVNEFAARLPSMVVSALIVALVFYLARQQRGSTVAWIAAAMLSTSILFFILSGSVIMDPPMTLGTTLSMVAFWQAMRDRGRIWGYVFFVGLAIGMMTKGPVAVVLTVLPVIVWLTLSGNWRHGWRRIPLFSGTALLLALSMPWYLLAERATPGFLEYFFIGEHWRRFTEPGWTGDLYGTAHSSTAGTIWVQWLVAAIPVSLVLAAALIALVWKKRGKAAVTVLRDDWSLYLVLWAIAPMVFFTLSGNVLATYVLPGLPPAAVLAAGFWRLRHDPESRPDERGRKSIAIVAIAGVLVPLIYLGVVLFYMPAKAEHSTEKFLVQRYHELDGEGSTRLVYLQKRPFSAEFYSGGRAGVAEDANELRSIVDAQQEVFAAIRQDAVSGVPASLKTCLHEIGRYGRYALFVAHSRDCHDGP